MPSSNILFYGYEVMSNLYEIITSPVAIYFLGLLGNDDLINEVIYGVIMRKFRDSTIDTIDYVTGIGNSSHEQYIPGPEEAICMWSSQFF